MNRYLLLIFSFSLRLSLFAQTNDSYLVVARQQIKSYHDIISHNTPGLQAYNTAFDATQSFIKAISVTSAGTPEHTECRKALKELFPVMSDGAYFFAGLDNSDKVLQFACAHIDISLLSTFAEDNLSEFQSYPVLAYLAATNLFNKADYETAINYYKAYLNTQDMANREFAFEGLARCFYEQKDYDRAAYIASQGSRYYPSNWNMLLISIESYGHGNQDNKMEPLLNRALALSPDHKGLLEYQGKMFERQRKYEHAINTFEKLLSIDPNSLHYTLHLGFNLYNAGISAIQADMAHGKSQAEATANPLAKIYFSKAAPHLQEVINYSPNAKNVAYALANCYAQTNNTAQLEKANQKLTALNENPVGKYSVPKLIWDYNPNQDSSNGAKKAEYAMENRLSDVDIDIPVTNKHRTDTYVVVFGNEKYKHKTSVPYANHDAKIFAEYCNKTLGIPKDQIRECYDATYSEIQAQLRYLSERTIMSPNELNIIFYYAGHGVPNVRTNTGYLLPVDSDGTDFGSCIAIDDITEQFDTMPVKRVAVFLDACFSGGTRDNEMLFTERFVETEINDFVTKGNTIIFSATDGKQTAMGYDEENHGFFTYYLLKHLKDSRGIITFKDLAEKLRLSVETKSLDIKNKKQTPQVKASPSLGDSWHNLSL